MNKILRSIGLAAAVVGSLGLGTTPANAAGGAVFSGTANIACFGCGVSTGTATLCLHAWADTGKNPPAGGHLLVNEPCQPGDTQVTATYSVTEIPGQCPVTGSASGSTAGAFAVNFNWTRVGATALITTTGDINGGGVAAFAVTDPIGNPCGGPVTAAVVGAVAGA